MFERRRPVRRDVLPAADAVAAPALADELIAYLREHIAHYKVPRSMEFLDELPRTATGKLQKHQLPV